MSMIADEAGAGRGVSITPALATDIAPVMTVMADAFDPAFGEAWNASQCLGILHLPGVWMLLARHEGEPAGFALARIVLDEAELLLIGVRPAFRRHGIGSALLDRVKHDARARGGARLHLEVRDGNPALTLYHQRGFVRIGCRPGYYRGADGASFDALSLSSTLDPDICATGAIELVKPKWRKHESAGAAVSIAPIIATGFALMPDATIPNESLIALTADIVSAHISNNAVAVADLPLLIQHVHRALDGLGGEAEVAVQQEPAVSVRSSVKGEYIVCLEDGKKLKMLKRHLMTHYQMTPEQYRAKWKLPADYPMVAPNYAEQRRALAKKIGLGTRRRRA